MRRIIDKRTKEKFILDDYYLNGQAKLCGWQATITYVSLCRHANKSQECFPSIKLMSEELNVSRNTIIKGLKNLENYNVIQIEKTRNKKGQWLNNTYFLIDKSKWFNAQVDESDLDTQVPVVTQPSPSGDISKSPTGTLRKHIEGNTYKETHISVSSDTDHKQIIEIFDLFKGINPTINYGHRTNRKACSDLIGQFGLEKTISTAKYAISVQGQQYAPTITTPYQLKNKMGDLKVYYNKQTKNPRTIKI